MSENYGHRHLTQGQTLTTEEFVTKARLVHGNKFGYLSTEYRGSKAKIKIECRKHGIFYQIPADHLSGTGCRRCYIDGRKKWSIDQDDLIRADYPTKGAAWCAEQLGKTVTAVRGRVAVLGLGKRQRFSHPHIPSCIWSSLIGRVRDDGYALDFDVDFVWDLYIKQGGKCALTGWDITFDKTRVKNTVSIDRIDSREGYLKTNVQLTHKTVNRCKLNTPEQWFYAMCKGVSEHRKGEFDPIIPHRLTEEWDEWNDTIRLRSNRGHLVLSEISLFDD